VVKYPRIKVYVARLIELLLYITSFPFFKKKEDKREPKNYLRKRFLIVEPFGLGDLILMTSMIGPIKKTYPGCEIGVICRSQWKDFLENHSEIDKVHHHNFFWSRQNKSFNIKDIYELIRFCKILRREKYDIGFDIRGDIRSVSLLVMANCKEKYGFLDYMGSNITNRGQLLTRAIPCGTQARFDELSSLLECSGINIEEPLKINLSLKLPSKPDRDYKKIGIHIGAGWTYREWKAGKWVKVIELLTEIGAYEIVLIGNSNEQRTLTEINLALGKNCRQLETKDLESLILSITDLDLLICLDSAPSHIATGCNVPTVKLFGPGVVERWGNLGGNICVIHHQEEYPCAPCTQIKCIHPDNNCMDRISVEEVVSAAIKLIN
jgi:ADP-heptose:LPS heptosyltransferase